MKNYLKLALIAAFLPLVATSCLEDDTKDYSDWRHQNDNYIAELDKSVFEPITPDWAPQNTIYMKWENDRSLTANALKPMANSTVDCIYELSDINGTIYDRSYSYSNPDSIFTCTPQSTVIGFEIALMNMHVGDSVSLVIPYVSGYGYTGSGSIPPYTNLIYKLKLKAIKDFVRPNV